MQLTMCNNSSKMSGAVGSSQSPCEYGWIQINNAVCPYVERETDSGVHKLVPFSVLTEAADLRFRGLPRLLTATYRDRELLNGLSRGSGCLAVTFPDPTNLMTLEDMFDQSCSNVHVTKLQSESESMAGGEPPTTVTDLAAAPAPVGHATPTSQVVVTQTPVPTVIVPTVVAEYYSGGKKSQDQTGQQQRDSSKHANEFHHHKGSQSPPVSPAVFQTLPVRGLQYVTLFHVQLLCVVKEQRHYVSLSDLHRFFFSRWPLAAFNFILVSLLHCPSYELSRVDVTAIRRLSGDAPSSGTVISLADAEKMLPKVKGILRKLPAHLHDSILKFATRSKPSTDGASSRIPRLSLIMGSGERETAFKHPSAARGGIGAKFTNGRSTSSPSRYLKPRPSPVVTVKRLIEEKRKLTELSRPMTEPMHLSGGEVSCTAESSPHRNLPVSSTAPSDGTISCRHATADITRHGSGKGDKLHAVLEKLNKMKS